jgi:hypothetical protein
MPSVAPEEEKSVQGRKTALSWPGKVLRATFLPAACSSQHFLLTIILRKSIRIRRRSYVIANCPHQGRSRHLFMDGGSLEIALKYYVIL